ncbi:hypothetical protein PPERSA_06471 [Pseudocohnilembus persalinus]|uniref:Transmembrane protein n=1 Tax=Pseudocohnilembus persalinus TaxID=266149 RepID=A0A0V0QSF5_PSEPJ|nr:hypothetical protein PPERSA_06471 [Pseudocohnilembus persalinus]|eukprot:KRX04837.1 hypothetical protein PPERSA_06471 [Pseudocohnilembus persalinus]
MCLSYCDFSVKNKNAITDVECCGCSLCKIDCCNCLIGCIACAWVGACCTGVIDFIKDVFYISFSFLCFIAFFLCGGPFVYSIVIFASQNDNPPYCDKIRNYLLISDYYNYPAESQQYNQNQIDDAQQQKLQSEIIQQQNQVKNETNSQQLQTKKDDKKQIKDKLIDLKEKTVGAFKGIFSKKEVNSDNQHQYQNQSEQEQQKQQMQKQQLQHQQQNQQQQFQSQEQYLQQQFNQQNQLQLQLQQQDQQQIDKYFGPGQQPPQYVLQQKQK